MYTSQRLPSEIGNVSKSFSFKACSFGITPDKESSARVVIYREIGVLRAYTLESTCVYVSL